MKRTLTNAGVAQAWAKQSQGEGRNAGDSLSFSGRQLKSYRTTIGWHFGSFAVISYDGMTATTGKQLSGVRSALIKAGVRIIQADIFKYGSDAVSIAGEDILQALLERGKDAIDKAKRARTYRDLHIDTLRTIIKDSDIVAERFNLEQTAFLPCELHRLEAQEG